MVGSYILMMFDHWQLTDSMPLKLKEFGRYQHLLV